MITTTFRLYRKFFIDNICVIATLIVLLVPNRIDEIDLAAFIYFPLEFVAISLALWMPWRLGIFCRWIMSVLLAAGIIFKIADMATYQIFARPFNPIFDAYLLINGMHLLNGAVGTAKAIVIGLLLIALAAGLIALSFWMLARIRSLGQLKIVKSHTFLLIGVAALMVLTCVMLQRDVSRFYDVLVMHVNDITASVRELKSFQQHIDVDASASIKNDQLFNKLKGKDVLLVFIESYGQTVLDRPDFAQHVRPVLQKASADLASSGISARSAYLTSPTVGGISWLAHGTALSGLWINSQVRYDSLIMSQRSSLNRLFKRAGWRTAAVMPAITMAWPEGQYFGYDRIYAAKDLGYQGKPFNWITMPDQYTLSAFQLRERAPGHTPVMTEMALISSHAPWTPLPHLIDWVDVGDGSVFNSQALSGDSPEVVWKDNLRIREQYRKSIEYVLQTLVSYAITYGDDNLVILAFGDHQPAPLVTGNPDNRNVIVHLIARDPAIMDAVADWHWTDGMLPSESAPVWRMDELRPRLIDAFSQSITIGPHPQMPTQQ